MVNFFQKIMQKHYYIININYKNNINYIKINIIFIYLFINWKK